MAPSDADLMGNAAQPSRSNGGAGAASAQGGADGGGALTPLGGEGAVPVGGASSDDFSSFIPQKGLQLWLMADHGIGELDGKVARWADFSPQEADARQPVSTLQPRLVPAAAGVPALVEFDGADDQLALPEGFSDFTDGLTAFIVGRVSADSECQAFLHLSNGEEEEDVQIGRFHGSVHYEVATPSVWGPDDTLAIGQLMLMGVVHAPSKAPELRLNGVFMVTGAFTELPVTKPRSYNFLGRSLYADCQAFHGSLGEVILYSRALDSGEREAVQAYLQAKWTYEPPVKVKPGPGEIPAAQ